MSSENPPCRAIASANGRNGPPLSIAGHAATAPCRTDSRGSRIKSSAFAPFCVPSPWRRGPERDAIQAEERRALLTLRIGQYRSRSEDPGEALRLLIEEREDDPEFDREIIELMIRAREDRDGGRSAFTLLTERLGGEEPCDRELIFSTERRDREVSFSITGTATFAAEHLCKLGCEVAYR